MGAILGLGMTQLDRRPNESALVQSWIFNSNKVFATFKG